ncbi:MAG: hypothetical protein HFACDABA_01622 [Anaerolineales bacterium]|nr:hypothetical protein [Anaerolineales bacterium]
MSAERESHPAAGSLLDALPRAKQAPATAAPALSKKDARRVKPSAGFALAFAGMFCLGAFAVAFVLLSNPKNLAAVWLPEPQVTSTRPAYFARSDMLMPTLTFTPTITPLPTPTETPIFVEMSVLADTPTPERAPLSLAQPAVSYSGGKYILVDISEQHMYVYEGDALIWSWVASTGMNNATRTGIFAVQSRIPNAYGATWNIWMPNWLGIYWAGGLENGIHALPILPGGGRLWSGFLGRPVSYGCVVLGEYESGLLFDWAEIGTPVEIQW